MSHSSLHFTLLNQYFDHIYVLTLHRAVERHRHIEKELEGLQYSFFFGQDNQQFDINDLKEKKIYDEALAKKHHRYGKSMTKGALGCSWGHKLIYQDMLLHQYKQVLILEDDVVINREVIHLLPDMLKALPRDWQLLYLGFEANEEAPMIAPLKKIYFHLLHICNLIKYSHATIRHLYPKKVSAYVHTAGFHNCTHAYAITTDAAKLLIELQTPISFVADNLLAYAATNQLLKAYTLLPKPINQLYQVTDKNTYSFVNE